MEPNSPSHLKPPKLYGLKQWKESLVSHWSVLSSTIMGAGGLTPWILLWTKDNVILHLDETSLRGFSQKCIFCFAFWKERKIYLGFEVTRIWGASLTIFTYSICIFHSKIYLLPCSTVCKSSAKITRHLDAVNHLQEIAINIFYK